jgi:hypothetical protein
MSPIVLSIGLALMSADSNSGLWVGKPPRAGWFATNQDGFCSLRSVLETSEVKLEFLFVSRSTQDDSPYEITFQVNATPAHLVRPVRLAPGSEPTAATVEVGSDASPTTSLSGPGVQQLLAYLKDGKGLDVSYSLVDGIQRRIYLDALKFSQSVAMFEACTAHVA